MTASPGTALAMLYLIASTLTLLVYGFDKVAAIRGARRVPELFLHLLGLAGGWPGGLVAQRLFRHKCGKRRFRLVSLAVALGNLTLTALLGSSLYF